jgi:hypothetical protein
MLNMGMYPTALGKHFLTVYRDILETRLKAKHSGDKVTDSVLKIVLNGTFGKTSNRYSILYNPKMMIQTTLTGQLSLLMLIEALEHRGVKVVSANTDGIVIKCPRARYDSVTKLIHRWEKITNLETEETRYRSLYSRDVNNYIAIKENGSAKTKGVFATSSIAKNPQRMGPLTLAARAMALQRVLGMQAECNAAALASGRPQISLIDAEEEARIRYLIDAQTWPDGWDGDEPGAETVQPVIYQNGAVQPLLFSADERA